MIVAARAFASGPVGSAELDKGIELFLSGHYAEAEAAFHDIIAGPAPSYWLGECAIARKDYQGAIGYLEAAVGSDGAGALYASRSLLRLGAVLEETDRRPEAGAAYARILLEFGAEPAAPEAAFRLAGISYRDGLYRKAAELYGKILIDYPSSDLAGESRFFLAESEYAQGNLDEAKKRYRSVVEGNAGRRSAASFRLAEISCKTGNREEAVAIIQDLLDDTPADEWSGRALRLEGDIYFDQGDIEGAIRAYEEALPLEDEAGRQGCYYALALAFLTTGETEKAMESLKRAGDGEAPLAKLAALLAAHGREEEAAAVFEKLLSLYPGTSKREEVVGCLAGIYFKAGDVGKTLSSLGILILEFPGSARFSEYLFRRASLLLKLDDDADALGDLQRIIKDFPNSPYRADSLYCVGYAYARRSEYSRALPYLRQALESAPSRELSLRTQIAMASCMFDMDDCEGAIAAFSSILERTDLNGLRGYILLGKARTLYKMGSFLEAEAGFQDASQNVPTASEAAEALFWRGWCFSRLERFAAARDAFLLVDDRYPDSARAAESLLRAAGSAIRLTEDEMAVGMLERSILRAREAGYTDIMEEALFEKASALSRLGRSRESEAAIDELSKEFPDSALAAQALYARAADAMIAERYAEARVFYGEVSDRFHGNPLAEQALYWEGESALASGDPAGAAGIFYGFLESYPRGAFLSSALDGLRRALMTIGDPGFARDLTEKSGADPRFSSATRSQIGLAYARILLQKSPGDAVSYLYGLIESAPEPEAGEASLILGMCYTALGEKQSARQIFQDVIRARSDRSAAAARMEMARLWEAEGKTGEALSEFSQVYKSFPEYSDLAAEGLFNAARLAYRIGERGIASELESLLAARFAQSPWVKMLEPEKDLP
jgi:TolA-binding protein